ncbi:MAG: oxygenase [Deltaproteobacteria bacterium]|nr:oxygenase [Deltaproteobacteria bacterium]
MRIVYEGRIFECRDGETVLDVLLRHGQNPAFSCRNGSCLVCLQRCVRGVPTERSQRALRASLRRAGYFLPCKCVPTGELELAPPRDADLFSRAVVHAKERVADDVCKLVLEPATSLYYHAGQFVNLRRSDGLVRSYSLASLPTEDEHLELHVKRIAGGAMSTWICDELAVGDELDFQGPNGRCYYVPGSQDQDLLLIANGTGAAPLVGIVRDALHVGHRGRIRLFHGSRTEGGLYLHSTFTRLAADHPTFEYVPCISSSDVPPGFTRGRAHQVALARCPDLRGWRVFVAGLPALVTEVETLAQRAGALASAIHADPYGGRAPVGPVPDEARVAPSVAAPPIAEGTAGRNPSPPTDPDHEMWDALDRGERLRAILTDFYSEVFADPALAPYFRGITLDRVIGQVFSFMRDVFTGEKQYFGMRPRTAHHWMVISNELFDHRERMMEACLRRHGLPTPLIERWRRFEERFRTDIVKATPWKLVIDGLEMPLDGFGELVLSVGTICDSCQRAVDTGERVRYHLRLGLTYCNQCTQPDERDVSREDCE